MLNRVAAARTVAGWALAALLLALFVVMKSYSVRPDLGDEAIYFYDGAALATGKLPYRDFTLAHPPLQVLLLAPLFALFGPSWWLGKLITPLLALLSALLVLRLARRSLPVRPGGEAAAPSVAAHAGPDGPGARWEGWGWASWLAGLVALGLFVTSYDVLRCSSHYTGADLGTVLALASLERSLARRPVQAGLLAALAGLTGFYAAPAPVVAGGLLFLLPGRSGRKDLLRFVLAAGGLFLAVNLLCVAVAGRAYLDQVYLFHLAKPAHKGGNLPLWHALARDNLLLVAGGVLGALLLGLGIVLSLAGRGRSPGASSSAAQSRTEAKRTRLEAKKAEKKARRQAGQAGASERAAAVAAGRSATAEDSAPGSASGLPPAGGRSRALDPWRTPLALVAGLAIHALAVLALNRVYTYYFAPAYPLLAVLGGFAVGQAVLLLGAPARAPGLAGRPRTQSRARQGAAALLAAFAVSLLLLPARLDPITAADQGKVKRYRWFEDGLLPAVDPLVRRLLWQDERKLDLRYGSLLRYLWHESRYSEAAPLVAEHVRRHARPDDLLFGDSMSAPLIALLTGHRLAGDMADTNRQHYWSGERQAAQDLARVDGPSLRWVVCRGRVGICGEPAVWKWLNAEFRLAARFPDTRQGGRLFLFERRSGRE